MPGKSRHCADTKTKLRKLNSIIAGLGLVTGVLIVRMNSLTRGTTGTTSNVLLFRNISSLGILRHFARVGSQESGEAASPREAHENTRQARPSAEQSAEPQAGALDYRFQPADTQHAEVSTNTVFLTQPNPVKINQIGFQLLSLKVIFYN